MLPQNLQKVNRLLSSFSSLAIFQKHGEQEGREQFFNFLLFCYNINIMNKRKILINILSVLTVGVAFFAWLSVRSAVIVPDSSTWIIPMSLFAAYVVLVCLDIILFRDMLLLELVLIGSLASSLLLAFGWLQFGAILLGAYFIFLASRKIREDLELSIKIRPWKSLQTGKSYLVLSLAVVICAQYFLTIKSFDGEKKVPHFDASIIAKKIAIPFISAVNPQFKVLRDETLTVDQFILQSQDAAMKSGLSAAEEEMLDAQLPANLTQAQKELIKNQARENFSGAQSQVAQKNQELILSVGKKQLSDVVGVSVTGNEKISDVFTGLINNKINDYFNPKMGGTEKNSVFPTILATVLFLIVFPVGLLLCVPCFLIARLLMLALFKLKILSVSAVTVTKEVLE